jgi:hypothetical protein
MKISRMLAVTFSMSLFAAPAFAQVEDLPEEEYAQPLAGEVEIDGVPRIARDTILRHVGDGQIRFIERMEQDDQTVFSVEFRGDDGMMYKLKVDENGKLLEKKQKDTEHRGEGEQSY